jgi:hypothetical protein
MTDPVSLHILARRAPLDMVLAWTLHLEYPDQLTIDRAYVDVTSLGGYYRRVPGMTTMYWQGEEVTKGQLIKAILSKFPEVTEQFADNVRRRLSGGRPAW